MSIRSTVAATAVGAVLVWSPAVDWVTAAGATGTFDDIIIDNTSTFERIVPIGTGHADDVDGVTYTVYREAFSNRPWLHVRNTASGASSHVSLPAPDPTWSDWYKASYEVVGDELWMISGDGPVTVRRWGLSGGPLPTDATLEADDVFGDADSRAGDLTVLDDGSVVAVWHQQGNLGPQGLHIARWAPATGWTQLPQVSFLSSRASHQQVVQHPDDGSVWLFHVPDAWGSIGAVHLTPTAVGGLTIDWTDGSFIGSQLGDADADPEHAFISAVPDPVRGEIVLGYQSSVRQVFSISPWVVGSRPAVARIAADGTLVTSIAPVWVERSLPLHVSIDGDTVWVDGRLIDEASLTYDDLVAIALRPGGWDTPVLLMTMADGDGASVASPTTLSFVAVAADYKLHARVVPTNDEPDSTISTTEPTSTKKGGRTQNKPGGFGKGGKKK